LRFEFASKSAASSVLLEVGLLCAWLTGGGSETALDLDLVALDIFIKACNLKNWAAFGLGHVDQKKLDWL